MQERAAVIYVALFLVIAAGAYALVGSATAPTVTVDDPEYTLSENDTFEVNDREFTLTDISEGRATATWTNESARLSESLSNESTVAYRGDDYQVRIPAEDDPDTFTLREEQNVSEPTVEENGTTYVIVEDEGENRTLVPVDEYLPDPQTHEFSEGDTFEYNDTETNVANVSSQSVELTWTGPEENTVTLTHGQVNTIDGQDYIVHIEGDRVQLTDDINAYQEQTAAVEQFEERTSGLWGVTILSGLTALLLFGMAFLPVRS